MRKNIFYILILAAVLSTGCKKYLDVYPKSSISQTQLFESEIGFQQAITGVYTQMASAGLYGDRLTMGFMSALAQDYSLTWNGAPLQPTRALLYTSTEVVGHLNTIWQTGYNAIAAVNNILGYAETNRGVLRDSVYQMVRGEALAIRGLIHFDLLRIYAPEYSGGASKKAIPFETQMNQFANIPSTAAQVMNNVLKDLQDAAALLKNTDPALQGVNLAARRTRMNYYAVKALEARARLYMGDKEGAFAAASEVVNSNWFPFVNLSAAGAAAATRDRLYVSELILGLRARDIATRVNGYFKFGVNAQARLTRPYSQLSQLYASPTGTDIRLKYLFEEDQGVVFPSKYWQTWVSGVSGESQTTTRRLDQFVPVLRISEMYLILAETAPTPAEGLVFLNKVRAARAIDPIISPAITQEDLEKSIDLEFRKDTYAEGQTFFFYKRKKRTSLPFNVTIPAEKYVLPIPDAELEYNPNYNG